MKDQIDAIRKTRTYLLDLTKELSLEQLNKIPTGFNNNIIWNLGHLVAAQQGVCYMRAGLKPRIDEELFNKYKPGSKPENVVNEQEVNKIQELLLSTLNVLEKDYDAGLWTGYNAWTTRYGIELKSINEALQFLNFHEGLHSGYIMALKRVS